VKDDREKVTRALAGNAPFAACFLPGESSSVAFFSFDGSDYRAADGTRLVVAPWPGARPAEAAVAMTEAVHAAAVESAKRAIRSGEMEKTVLSRIHTVGRTGGDNPDPADLFFRLREAYPAAFCYVLVHPEFGMWMGATPETLVALSGGVARTMALAGTRRAGDAPDQPWGEKELHEHDVVVQEIMQRLAACGQPSRQPVRTITAGPVQHLLTGIEVPTQQDILRIARLLHPTSAVCGWPREAAAHWIRAHEPHSRELYAGYLGVVRPSGEGHLFVNLRCMKILPDRYQLYVGGGITASSEPAEEWRETGYKAQTLLRVIG
jgi:isochorismate synthase